MRCLGSSSGNGEEIGRRRALAAAAAVLYPVTARALELPALPSVPLPEIDMFPSDFQRAANELANYRKPLADMASKLNSMPDEQETEDKVFFFSTISYFLSPTQRPSLILSLERLAPVIGEDGDKIASEAKEAVSELQKALRASNLPDEKRAVRDLSAVLESSFAELRKRDPSIKLPLPKEVGNGSFFGVLPAIKA